MPKPPSRRWIVAVALVVSALLLMTYGWLWYEASKSEALRNTAAQSSDRRMLAADLLARLADAETAQRDYLLTGDRRYLSLYEPAKSAFLSESPTIVEDAPDMALRDGWTRFQQLAEGKFAEMDRTIALRDAGRPDAALDVVREGTGWRAMSAMRRVATSLAEDEASILEAKRSAFRNQRERLAVIVFLVIAAIIALLIGSLWLLHRSRWQRYTALIEAIEGAERYRSILDSTHDALVILNPSGGIEVVNAATGRLLGRDPNDLVRKDLSLIVDTGGEDRGSFLHRMGVTHGRLPQTFLSDRSAHHADGSQVPVDIALGLMDLPDGPHLVLSMRDVSEHKRAERMKDELIATVSHELRTPLTSIVGSLGLLSADDNRTLPEDARQLVDIAHNNSLRLIRLINDMLDIDRIEGGFLRMAHDPVDLAAVAREAVDAGRGAALAKGLRLGAVLPDAPVMITGDAGRLQQVAANLISNAIHAAPRASLVEVRVEIDAMRAILSVEDAGSGVPEELRSRLFGRFERARIADGSIGAGLGLAISREIVSRHDGSIWFEDRAGGGTRFRFALPLRAKESAATRQTDRILLATTDEGVVAALDRLAGAMDLFVVRVSDLATALDMIEADDFDAAVIGIAETDAEDDGAAGGFTFAEAVHRRASDRGLPVVLVSPSKPSVAFGIVDWMTLPIEIERLEGALSRTLGQRGEVATQDRSGERPLVLHLDDDPDLLELVGQAIGKDVRLRTAATLKDARLILREESPSAAIIDLHLERGNGLDLLPDLVDADGAAIPAIVFSAYEVRGQDLPGVDSVLIKAQDTLPDLAKTLGRILQIGREP